MSDTPKLPDECKRLLDNGWTIVLQKSPLGDYSAIAIRPKHDAERRVLRALRRLMRIIPYRQFTGDFTPSQALSLLPEKVFGCEGASHELI